MYLEPPLLAGPSVTANREGAGWEARAASQHQAKPEPAVRQVEAADVELHIGKAASADDVLAVKPDAVILAVGANNFAPAIPGIDGINVCDAWKVLAGEQEVFGRVAVEFNFVVHDRREQDELALAPILHKRGRVYLVRKGVVKQHGVCCHESRMGGQPAQDGA